MMKKLTNPAGKLVGQEGHREEREREREGLHEY
jgi:hypothetical protein